MESKRSEMLKDLSTTHHNGGISKKILELGSGNLLPKIPSIVKIVYEGYVTCSRFVFDIQETPVTITLGNSDYPEGFTVGIENMKKGEYAEIQMNRRHT